MNGTSSTGSTGSTGRSTTRRGFLATSGALTAGAAALGLTGCSRPPSFHDTGYIKVPDPQRKLPQRDLRLRVMDSGDTKAPFWKELADAYEEKHPNVSFTYDALPWSRIAEVVPLGIRNGTAHDIMQMPPSIPLIEAAHKGWIAPLNDIIPDFERWRASFPAGTFAEGVQVFDGKIYSVPLASEQRHQALLHYNKDLMEQAGFDPHAEPLTWDSFRKLARRITRQHDGQAYGVILDVGQPGRMQFLVHYLAASAGTAAINYVPHGFIDARNGEFAYTQDGMAEAIELLLALKKDGSVFPGSGSLTAPETWPRVLRGNAGMVPAGPWVAETWQREKPDFSFGVMGHPVAQPDGYPVSYPVFGTDGVVVFGPTKVERVVGDVLSYATSLEGQLAWGKIVGVGNPPINEQARASLRQHADPMPAKCLELAADMPVRPEPVVRNPDVALLAQKQKPVRPNFGEVVQAVFLGEADGVRKALRQLQDRSNRLLEEAITDARKEGIEVSREDFVFPNWDPARDYTSADYEELSHRT